MMKALNLAAPNICCGGYLAQLLRKINFTMRALS